MGVHIAAIRAGVQPKLLGGERQGANSGVGITSATGESDQCWLGEAFVGNSGGDSS